MAAITFIVFNLVDASLTRVALAVGATEANPLLMSTGGNILVKGLVATGVVLILYWLQKEKVLRPLNFIFFAIILWNLAVYGIMAFSRLDYAISSQ